MTRLTTVRARLDEQGLDGLLISQPENRRYLSGFTGSSGVLLVTPWEAFIVTDSRYFEQVGREVPQFEFVRQSGRLAAAIGGLVARLDLRRVGIESEAVTVAEFGRWQAAAPSSVEWVPTEGLATRLRAVKDATELDLVRRAQAIADGGYECLLTIVQPGKTEKQVAWEFEVTLRELGADAPAFPIIVASGPNAALPHYRAGPRVIGENEIVLVDFGARVDGYHSDCTRTLFTGDPATDPEFVRVYGVCLDALETAEAAIRAGVGNRAADAIARDVIAAAGHGDDFGHSLGHGIGLAVHEEPFISYRAEDGETVPAGSLVTIEPGIYRPGWGGVRIEDLAVVHEDGVEVLTRAGKEIDAWRHANRG